MQRSKRQRGTRGVAGERRNRVRRGEAVRLCVRARVGEQRNQLQVREAVAGKGAARRYTVQYRTMSHER